MTEYFILFLQLIFSLLCNCINATTASLSELLLTVFTNLIFRYRITMCILRWIFFFSSVQIGIFVYQSFQDYHKILYICLHGNLPTLILVGLALSSTTEGFIWPIPAVLQPVAELLFGDTLTAAASKLSVRIGAHWKHTQAPVRRWDLRSAIVMFLRLRKVTVQKRKRHT